MMTGNSFKRRTVQYSKLKQKMNQNMSSIKVTERKNHSSLAIIDYGKLNFILVVVTFSFLIEMLPKRYNFLKILW